jgi:hypothetical protein
MPRVRGAVSAEAEAGRFQVRAVPGLLGDWGAVGESVDEMRKSKMNDPVILFVKPGSVSKGDLGRLWQVGVCVVQVESPSEVKLMRANAEISTTEMLSCAAKAIAAGNDTATKVAFANAMVQAIRSKDAPAPLLPLKPVEPPAANDPASK